jgi:hypothetical protein
MSWIGLEMRGLSVPDNLRLWRSDARPFRARLKAGAARAGRGKVDTGFPSAIKFTQIAQAYLRSRSNTLKIDHVSGDIGYIRCLNYDFGLIQSKVIVI